jgi:hypothetical protein
MRTLKNKFWALLLITSVSFLSCKKQDPLPPITPAANSTTGTSTNNPTFTRGDWKIALFQEGAADETTNFRGYLFTFESNGHVLAKKDNTAIVGDWSTVKESDGMKFIINFPGGQLSELNGDWKVKSETYTDLRLEHVSGGDGSVDYLNFERYFAQGNVGNIK